MRFPLRTTSASTMMLPGGCSLKNGQTEGLSHLAPATVATSFRRHPTEAREPAPAAEPLSIGTGYEERSKVS